MYNIIPFRKKSTYEYVDLKASFAQLSDKSELNSVLESSYRVRQARYIAPSTTMANNFIV